MTVTNAVGGGLRAALHRLWVWVFGDLTYVGEDLEVTEEDEWTLPWHLHQEVLEHYASLPMEAKELVHSPVDGASIVHHANRWLEKHEVADLIAVDEWSSYVAWTTAETLISTLAATRNASGAVVLKSLMTEANLSQEQATEVLGLVAVSLWAAAVPFLTYAARHRVDEDVPFPFGEPVHLEAMPPMVTTEEVDQ